MTKGRNYIGSVGVFLLTRPLRDVTKGRNYIGSVGVFLLTRPLRDVTATFCIYVTEHFHILGRTYFC